MTTTIIESKFVGRNPTTEFSCALMRRMEKEKHLAEYDMTYLVECCESPLEKILAPWLLTISTDFDLEISGCARIIYGKLDLDALVWDDLILVPQFEVGKYRLDFALFYRAASWTTTARIAIECDGHDYHDGSKDAAERDKKRNRYLASKGWYVFRFSGREIHRDPEKCASEIENLVRSIYRGGGRP